MARAGVALLWAVVIGACASSRGAKVAAAAPVATHDLDGRVALIARAEGETFVTLTGSEAAAHAFDRFAADARTVVTVNGRRATLAETAPGDPVRARYEVDGARLRLVRLDVRTGRE